MEMLYIKGPYAMPGARVEIRRWVRKEGRMSDWRPGILTRADYRLVAGTKQEHGRWGYEILLDEKHPTGGNRIRVYLDSDWSVQGGQPQIRREAPKVVEAEATTTTDEEEGAQDE